jgi:glycolate oxidase FAD binding subunit
MHLSTARLTDERFTESTATFGAGTPLAHVHAQLGKRGRLLALDPPLGQSSAARTVDSLGATLGGTLATADSGPLAHRYGGARDQVLDMLVALPDGSLVRSSEDASGSEIISLLTGSYGTLGAVLEVTVTTHPLPGHMVTVLGTAGSAAALTAASGALADWPEPVIAVDYAWHAGAGGLLVMLDCPLDDDRVTTAVELLSAAGLQRVEPRAGAEALWARQRAGQRSSDRAVVRVTGPRDTLPQLLAQADASGATVVGRAIAGCSYLTVDVSRIAVLREHLPAQLHANVTDLPGPARGVVSPWEPVDDNALMLMRSIKEQYDPLNACNPGIFVGGI